VKLRKNSLIFLIGNSIFFIFVAALLVAPAWKRRGPGNLRSLANLLPVAAQAAEVNPWTLAVEKVKEDRGEPTGKQAKVETPTQLRHYSDTRRFLAIQVAEVKQHQVETPQDLVDLAAMIGSGELVQLQPVKENYILFGVGGNADKQPFTRYENGKSIRLHNEAGLRQEYNHLAESHAKFANDITDLKVQLSSLKRRERAQRAKLQTQITAAEKSLKLDREDKALLDRYYGNLETRQQLFAAYESLEKLVVEKFRQLGKLDGSQLGIADPDARQQMKVRMLSSLRPEALKVLEEVAASYHEKFNRPLPITSLVRPDEYQHQLSKTNPNATRIETPPHSTGLAFDILYRYMTAAEQSHVMAHLAQLKDEGRIEVLRENRDHYHVFAFVDGARPSEEFISASLGERPAKLAEARSANVARLAHHSQKKTAHSKREVPKREPRSVRVKRKSRR
jgi:uncharacterized protein DUF5715